MEREIMPDYGAEVFYQYLISPGIFGGSEEPQPKANRCIVFCKKISPNLYDISKGVAMVAEAKSFFNDGICMIAPATKVVFVFE